MKIYKLLLTFVFLSTIATYGQKDTKFFFDEFCISINRTNLQDNNTNNKTGFGIAIYHNFMDDKKVNVLFGFDFNQTVQLKKYVYEGHVAYSTNVTYKIYSLSIPFSARLNFGKKIKIFAEGGTFLDLNLTSQKIGTMHSIVQIQNNQWEYVTSEYSHKAGISGINYGLCFGIGFKIPVTKYELLIKTDYKYGMNELSNDYDPIYNKYLRLMIGLNI